MRLLSLDFDPVYGDDATRSTFSSDLSVFDYDIVIWDPAVSFASYFLVDSGEYYQGLPALSEHNSVRMQADSKRRRAEFAEFVKMGRVLTVIVRPPQRCYVETGDHSYSGTGRNRVSTRHVKLFDLLSAVPNEEFPFISARGTRIEFNGNGPMVELLRKYKSNLAYDAVMKDPPGVPLAHVEGTDRIVASILRIDSEGYLILLPAINLREEDYDGSDEDDEAWLPEAPDFQHDLLSAISNLSGSKSISRPEWIERYATEEQEVLRVEIVQQQAQIEAARDTLAKLQKKKEIAESKDQLFLGSGRALELEVKVVMELLGGTVTEPEPGRDDWKVSFPEGNAVLEVKGVKKSAAEKHAAQLEKWVSGEFEKTEKKPKGILIINTWRNLPLAERVEESFPDQMLPYCQGRQHCLVTGLQLFVIRSEVEKNAERAEFWRKQLLDTSGRISGCEDWKPVIREVGVQSGDAEEERSPDEQTGA